MFNEKNNVNKKQTVEKEAKSRQGGGWNFCHIPLPVPETGNGSRKRQNFIYNPI